MRRALMTFALLGASIAIATPALAGKAPSPATDPCSYAVVTGAVACVGYYDGNLLTGAAGSSTTSTEQTYINQLLSGPATTSNSTGYNPPYTIATNTVLAALGTLSGTAGQPYTYNFSPLLMTGFTVLGAHFGNFPDTTSPNVTAFWLVNVGRVPTSSITISNGQGISNAQIFGTSTPAVPEPTTWAMMLIGFTGMGLAFRRKPASSNALMQIA